MLKIRDLGINALPDAFETATKKKGGAPKCAKNTCRDTSQCPRTGHGGLRKNHALAPNEIDQLRNLLLHKMAEH